MTSNWRFDGGTTDENRRGHDTAPRTKARRSIGVLCLGLVLAGCRSAPLAPASSEISISKDIGLRPIAKGVWVHTTFFDLPGMGRVPANGLLIIDGKEALLVDLPWTDDLTATLCNWVTDRHRATVKTVIPTHFHEDCMGGLAEAQRRGAASYGLDRTIEIARQKGLPIPKIPYHDTTTVRCGGTTVIVTYLGAGHTTDNVVAWLPKQQILFAGCLVKALDATSLGNTKDGDLAAYPATLRKVQAAYPQAKIVVPGHGSWGGPELIEHTLRLCQAQGPQPGGQ